jgi:hypothetical protein
MMGPESLENFRGRHVWTSFGERLVDHRTQPFINGSCTSTPFAQGHDSRSIDMRH